MSRPKKYLTEEERILVNKERSKNYYLKNKEVILSKQKEYYKNNQSKIIEYQKNYTINNKEKIKEYKKDYSKNNKEIISLGDKNYYIKNKEIIRKKQQNYKSNRMKTDYFFKLKENLSSLIRISFKNKGFKKNSKTINILGCSFEEFKDYLESKFEVWMDWENRGLYNSNPNYGWDIDHIIPISSAKSEEDIIKLNHYSNLQPLCSYVNRVIKRNS
jgi:hypothetical protein